MLLILKIFMKIQGGERTYEDIFFITKGTELTSEVQVI